MPSAGAVSPPVIVALVKKGKHKTGSRNNNVVTIDGSAVTNNRKNKSANNIYKDTYIELTTDTPECKIFFTVDNSKPLPYSTKCLEGRSTFLYQGPFLLKSGRRIVKAVAATRDGLKTSFVTTKTFNVQSVAEEADDVNEYNNKNLESNNNPDEGYDGRPISAPTNVPMARSVSAYNVNDRNMQYNNNFYPGYNNNNYNNNNGNWNMSYVGQNLLPAYQQPQLQQQLYDNNISSSFIPHQQMPANMWGIPVTHLHNLHNGVSRSYNNSSYSQLGYMTNRALENLEQPKVQLNDLRGIIREEGDRLLAINSSRLASINQPQMNLPIRSNESVEPQIVYVNQEPELTACSPGNGDWLGQVSHIYAHLKSHVASDDGLRIVFGSYQLGNLMDVDLASDENDDASLRITFKKIHGPKLKVKPPPTKPQPVVKSPPVINKPPITNNNKNKDINNNNVNNLKSIVNTKTMASHAKKKLTKEDSSSNVQEAAINKRDPYYKTEEYLAEGTLKAWPNFNSENDCEKLRKAMKGLGTDEKSIIDVLGYRTNIQRMHIVKQFKAMFGKDLAKELTSELSGKFLTCCEALCLPPDVFDASQIKKAVKGLGTDEDVLIEILCTRTNKQIEAMKITYKQLFKSELEKDIRGDTSGHFRKLLISQLQANRDENLTYDLTSVQDDVTELLRAGQDKWGTDESVFNKIMCQRSQAHLRALFREYTKKSNKNKTIQDAISSEFSGDVKNAFLAIVNVIENKVGYFADLLHKSMKGLGTNDDQLIRVVVSRCECDMVQIKKEFERKFNQPLQQWLKDDISGDYLSIILALTGDRPLSGETSSAPNATTQQNGDVDGNNATIDEDEEEEEVMEEEKKIPVEGTVKPFANFDAKSDCEVLRKAMKGLGTDESSIINVMSYRSNDQRAEIVQMFKTMFGKDLMSEFKSELSGNFLSVVLSLCKSKPQFYADELRAAMKGLGTDEDCLIEVLCTKSNDELNEIIKEYQIRHNKSLEQSIISETSGNLKRLFVSLLQANRPKTLNISRKMARRDAQMLMEAGELKKFGTDESRFNVILCSRSASQLRATFEEYMKLAGKDIIDSIKSEMSGDLRKAFTTIVNYIRDERSYYATSLYDSMHGLGTRDSKLIRVVVGRCEIDMVQIKCQFESKYKQTLAQYIKDDTSGDYRKILLALIGEPIK